MPQNRLTRDNILIQALDMADLPELDQNDRPAGTIVAGAISANWLQRALDEMHQEFPWAGTVTSATGSVTTLNPTLFAPADFILDVRNGLWLDVGGATKALIRRNFQDILNYQVVNDQGGTPATGEPSLYAFRNRTLSLDITPQAGGYTYTLWYYQLPAVPTAAVIPNFPSDHVLVDFTYLRALEWARKMPPGAAMKYLREVEIPALRASGLNQEPESDLIPLDPLRFKGASRSRNAWMGSTRPNL